MGLCKDCTHFKVFTGWPHKAPFGSCARWHVTYRDVELAPNECQVESDEGWGMIIGPEFGCVLWEAKMPLDIVTEPK